MDNYEEKLILEEKQLEYIKGIVVEQIEIANINNEKREAAIIEAKREMAENTRHSMGNLYSNDGFEELIELSQYAQQVSEAIDRQESEAAKIIRLERMINNPYFARIDFKYSGDTEIESMYIGRNALMDEKTVEFYVYDWRSPVASMFYRFSSGEAYYEAPVGKISGEISLKRQYEINRGKLDFFFDADMQIVDDFLRKLLSQNTSNQMKAIVETIQKDQDCIIRDVSNDLLIVQGVAGSGKTSVALHRVAYLMYQGMVSKLGHHNILIISPNSVFKEYISRVLPELGEENVVSLTYAEIMKTKARDDFSDIKHVVIDEAQDYDIGHFMHIKKVFPEANFTVLGDINQTLGDIKHMSFYDDVKAILNKKKAALVVMNKSFRCTHEILTFAAKYIDEEVKIESFNRNGDEPKVVIAKDRKQKFELILEELTFCQEAGYGTIGILTKNETDAKEIYKKLKDKAEMTLITSRQKSDFGGITIMPIFMAKGLEFDAVLICDAEAQHYESPQGKRLMYIACTRALHRLNLFA